MERKCKNCRFRKFYIGNGYACINVDSSYRNENVDEEDWCSKWMPEVENGKQEHGRKEEEGTGINPIS